MERLTNEQVYRRIAQALLGREGCLEHPDPFQTRDEWLERHEDKIQKLVKEYLPSGSGFDAGTQINLEESTSDKLVFYTSFHHMDENGMYDGWIDLRVTVIADLACGAVDL